MPLIVGLLVLVAAGVFLIGRSLIGTDPQQPTSSGTPEAAQAPGISLHPQHVEAVELIRAGQLEEAVELLESIPPTHPAALVARRDLALTYERLGRAEEAVAEARSVLDNDSEDPEALYVTCRALYRLDRLQEAEHACMRALEVQPGHAAARYSVALVRVARGNLDEGIDAYTRAIRMHGDETLVLQALADLNQLHTDHPEHPEVHYALAFFADTLRSPEQEKIELEHYLELAPEGPAADVARRKLETP